MIVMKTIRTLVTLMQFDKWKEDEVEKRERIGMKEDVHNGTTEASSMKCFQNSTSHRCGAKMEKGKCKRGSRVSVHTCISHVFSQTECVRQIHCVQRIRF